MRFTRCFLLFLPLGNIVYFSYSTYQHLYAWNTILPSLLFAGVRHRVHRVATAAFGGTFHNNGEIIPGWWGWGVHARPLSLYLPSRTKLWCTLYSPAARGQIHSSYFSSTPIWYSVATIFCKENRCPPSRLHFPLSGVIPWKFECYW
jgi:hypothetical protein